MNRKALLILCAVVIPFIAAQTFSFEVSPPGHAWSFGVTSGMFAACLGLVTWLVRDSVIALSNRWRVVLLLVLAMFVAWTSNQYLAMRRTCIVRPSDHVRYPDAPLVLFPRQLTGNALAQEQRWRTRPDMLNKLSPNGVEALIRQMPDYERELHRTIWILLSLHVATVITVTSCAGIITVLAISPLVPTAIRNNPKPEKNTPDRDVRGKRARDNGNNSSRRFDVALSFPGEYRKFVKQIAELLAQLLTKEKVFYDEFYEAELGRPNLDTYLQKIYHDDAELIVIFLCKDYNDKEWCHLEARAIRDLIKKRRDDDIMFVRVGDGEVDGVFSVDGYVDARGHSAGEMASLIRERLTGRPAPLPSQTPELLEDLTKSTAVGGELRDVAIAEHLRDACAGIQRLSPGGAYDFSKIAAAVKEAQTFYDEEQSTHLTFNLGVGIELRATATSIVCLILGMQMRRGDPLRALVANFANKSLPGNKTPLMPGDADTDRIYDLAVGDTANARAMDAIRDILISRYASRTN